MNNIPQQPDYVTIDRKPSFHYYNEVTGTNHELVNSQSQLVIETTLKELNELLKNNSVAQVIAMPKAESNKVLNAVHAKFQILKDAVMTTELTVYLTPVLVDYLAYVLGKEIVLDAANLTIAVAVYNTLYDNPNNAAFAPYKTSNKPKVTDDLLALKFNPVELNMFNQLLLTHTEKGLTDKTLKFYLLMITISKTLRAMSFYDINLRKLQEDITVWLTEISKVVDIHGALDENVEVTEQGSLN